jgi:membrane protease YdiL (CAAX protease family)
MRSLIRRHSAASYFTLAFAISWGGILAVIRGGRIPAPPEEAQRLFGLVYFAMLAGPSIAGLAMTAMTGGAPGLRDYRARLIKWRLPPVWYAIALFTAPVALALTSIVLSRFSLDFAPAIFGSGPIDPAGPVHANDVTSLLLLATAVGIGAGFFEELGWTGFAIPTLVPRLGPATTGIFVGVLWGAWHFLAVWWGSAGSFGPVPVPLAMLAALFTFLPPYRVLMVRVYERTGSLLVAILMHASLTASMVILGPPVKGTQSVIYNLAFATMLWLFVAGVRWRGARNRRERPITTWTSADAR